MEKAKPPTPGRELADGIRLFAESSPLAQGGIQDFLADPQGVGRDL